MDTTKTADNKSTFLHVVAKAVYANVPEVITFGDEIPMVPKACKVSLRMVNDELQEMKNKLEVSLTQMFISIYLYFQPPGSSKWCLLLSTF